MAASVLLPGGFFLGGIFIHGGDPGLGIFLVPLGAGFLFLVVLLTAVGVTDFDVVDQEDVTEETPTDGD